MYIYVYFVCIFICKHETFSGGHIGRDSFEMLSYHLDQHFPIELAGMMKMFYKTVLPSMVDTGHVCLSST